MDALVESWFSNRLAALGQALDPVASPRSFSRQFHLEQAGLRIGKHPDPVPAPFAGAVRADFVSCVPSVDSSRLMDCTICAKGTSPGRGVLTSTGAPGTRWSGRCRRSVLNSGLRLERLGHPLATPRRGPKGRPCVPDLGRTARAGRASSGLAFPADPFRRVECII